MMFESLREQALEKLPGSSMDVKMAPLLLSDTWLSLVSSGYEDKGM